MSNTAEQISVAAQPICELAPKVLGGGGGRGGGCRGLEGRVGAGALPGHVAVSTVTVRLSRFVYLRSDL